MAQRLIFDRAAYDEFEGTLELNFAMSNRTPIAYKGDLYYLHSVELTRLALVHINEIYIRKDTNQEGVYEFTPQNILWIYPDDFDLEYIKTVVGFAQNQVSVKYQDVLIGPTPTMVLMTAKSNYNLTLTGIEYEYDEESNMYTQKLAVFEYEQPHFE